MSIDQNRVLTHIAERDPLRVVPWPDPVIEKVGYPVDSVYAEHFWLPVIGPSALWALRRLVAGLCDTPEGFDVPLVPFAESMGLQANAGRNTPVVRTLARLVQFELAAIGPDGLHVRLAVPPLARRQLRRLPSHLQAPAGARRQRRRKRGGRPGFGEVPGRLRTHMEALDA